MKAKFLAIMLLGFVGVFVPTVNADELVAAPNYAAQGYTWNNLNYSTSYAIGEGLFVSGVQVLTKVTTVYGATSCYVNNPAAGYTLVGSSCSNYALYNGDAPSTSSMTSSSAPAVTCATSGKAGLYVGTYDGRTMGTAGPNATAYCAPCGITVVPAGGTNVRINCSN